MDLPPYVHPGDKGTRLDVFVQPRAARQGFAGVHGAALKLKVRAPALDGKANRAVTDLLSDVLGVPSASLAIVSGDRSRNKRIAIAGMSPHEVAARLEEALAR